ncbi:MAG: radical SAM protein [Candidatus Omnitrophica bacterium]|nr:radical SAM protein [Candidatus Omnitrophota bacterium]MCF7891950.1 radical SAM protein [Candidatus Omnitrophota bacterium]MCF7895488.1 radical SAM protein [Candidatus Omnitrophota bacterium]MCF7897999.1 radical SAM protein [Candidatus Omnitrophota bacterium]MCF7909647.1 radical SAM protein [Candidatus Omnitrophota bacterium]
MYRIKKTLFFFYKALKHPANAIKHILPLKRLINNLFQIYGIRYQLPVLDSIILCVTNFCNAHCLMCDIGLNHDKGMNILQRSEKREMDFELLKKISNDPYVLKHKPFFNILMTEPLLHSRIGAIVKELKENNYQVNLTTNGFLLPEKAQELAESGLDYLQVSIDGPIELHNRIRGIDVFRKAIEGIKKLNSFNAKPLININCVITNLNFSYLTKLVDKIEREGILINQFKFQFMYFVSEAMQKRNNVLGVKEMMQSESTINKYMMPDKVNIDILYKELQELRAMKPHNIQQIRIIPDIRSKKELRNYFNFKGEKMPYYDYCAWPFRQIAVKTDGVVLFHTRCFNYSLGSLLDGSCVRSVFFSLKAKYFRKQFKRYKFCLPACTRCCGVVSKVS